MYQIKVIEKFSAAHNLRNYKGKCEELHGHNWKVEAFISAESVDDKGMLIDFKDLKAALKNILSAMDHKYLNDIPYFGKMNPTSENIAKFIYDKLSKDLGGKKIKISVWETDTSCASFE